MLHELVDADEDEPDVGLIEPDGDLEDSLTLDDDKNDELCNQTTDRCVWDPGIHWKTSALNEVLEPHQNKAEKDSLLLHRRCQMMTGQDDEEKESL